jgi:caffeoyl-CoA O-methyltransferase
VKDISFLKAMVQKARARRVLEVGTFDGFSALAMAEALPEDGTVLTCEINPDLANLARKRLARSPHGRKVEVRIGPAMETMANLAGPFDMMFIDADTRNYVHYYRRALELLAPNGVLLMDNTRGIAIGTVNVAARARDPAVPVIEELGRLVQSDTRVRMQWIDTRDGVLMVTWAG